MRKQLFKIAAVATLMLALTSTAFADESKGNLRLGFQATVVGLNGVGLLLDLGNNLELGLGLGFHNWSSSDKTTASGSEIKRSENSWEIVPSVQYAFRRGDILSVGAGLDVGLGSSSDSETVGGQTTTHESDGIDMDFFPNFFIKAEPFKRFVIGLKTGININVPATQCGDGHECSETGIDLRTDVYVAFYL